MAGVVSGWGGQNNAQDELNSLYFLRHVFMPTRSNNKNRCQAFLQLHSSNVPTH